MGGWKTRTMGLAAAAVLAGCAAAGQEGRPAGVVAHALALMGGEAEIRAITHASLDMTTQWQRTSFRDVPYTDRPSYEEHGDRRDYDLGAWRNTRQFPGRNIVNVIRDSVALTDMGQGFRPLSSAYVDERDELFTYTPDRLMLALADAGDLRNEPDTALGGEDHRVVSATLRGRYPARVYFHGGTGLPTLLRFTAGHPNDFGLVQWGEMEVEVWYSGWRTFGGIAIPTQWDIVRVGAPYKRMTVRQADFATPIPADSFAVSDSARTAYWSSLAPLPMHEGVPLDPRIRPHDGLIAVARPFGIPAGAVYTGEGWVLLGAGQAPFNYDQIVEALEEDGVDRISAVLIGEARGTNGGVSRAIDMGVPVYVSVGAEPFVRTILQNAGAATSGLHVLQEEVTLGIGDDRLLVAPLDLPDAPGSLMAYKPSARWLFVPEGNDPLHQRMARDAAAVRGWEVDVVGTARAIWPDGG